MLFLEMKHLNRNIQNLGQNTKDVVQAKKNALDQLNLDLQGLQYEKSHFMKEIKKCKDFKWTTEVTRRSQLSPPLPKTVHSATELVLRASSTGICHPKLIFGEYLTPVICIMQEIPLIPKQEYLATVPGSADRDEHSLQLDRLGHELKTRQDLMAKMEKMKDNTSAMLSSNQNKRKLIDGLSGRVRKLYKDALEMQKSLPEAANVTPSPASASLLPRPLYNLYNIATCYITFAESSLEVAIDGDVDLAQKHHDHQTAPESPSSSQPPRSSSLDLKPHPLFVTLTADVGSRKVSFKYHSSSFKLSDRTAYAPLRACDPHARGIPHPSTLSAFIDLSIWRPSKSLQFRLQKASNYFLTSIQTTLGEPQSHSGLFV